MTEREGDIGGGLAGEGFALKDYTLDKDNVG